MEANYPVCHKELARSKKKAIGSFCSIELTDHFPQFSPEENSPHNPVCGALQTEGYKKEGQSWTAVGGQLE